MWGSLVTHPPYALDPRDEATTKYAYDAQNRLSIEQRDDDPTSATNDYARKYVYLPDGRLSQVLNNDCTSGSSVAEQYAYEAAGSGQIGQRTSHVTYNFSVASGACASSLNVDTTVQYGASGSSQEGSVTRTIADPAAVGAPTTTTDLQQSAQNELSAATETVGTGEPVSTITARAPDGRPVEETSSDRTGDGNSTVDEAQLTYAGEARDAATVKEVGDVEARGRLVAPNGWVIADHREPAGYDRYYVTDHLGTPVIEAGRSGKVAGTYDYDAWGQADPLKTSGDMTTSTGFAGERVDQTTGMTDHDARSYNADLRTWVSTDQYEDPEGDMELSLSYEDSDRMQYSGSNPINNTDPDGHSVLVGGSGAIRNVQVSGNGKVWTMSGGARNTGRTVSQGGVSAAQRVLANQKASAARWATNKSSTAYKSSHCSRGLVNGRCMTVAQEAQYYGKVAAKKGAGIGGLAVTGALGTAAIRSGMGILNTAGKSGSLSTLMGSVVVGTKLVAAGTILSSAEIGIGAYQDGVRGAGRGGASVLGGMGGGALAAAAYCTPSEAIPGPGTLGHGLCTAVGAGIGGLAATGVYNKIFGS